MKIVGVVLICMAVILLNVLLNSRSEMIENIQKKRLFEIGPVTYQCKVIPPLQVLK